MRASDPHHLIHFFIDQPKSISQTIHLCLSFFLTSLNGDFKNEVWFSGSVSWLNQINVPHLPLIPTSLLCHHLKLCLSLSVWLREGSMYLPSLWSRFQPVIHSLANEACVSLQCPFLFLLRLYHFMNFLRSSSIDFFVLAYDLVRSFNLKLFEKKSIAERILDSFVAYPNTIIAALQHTGWNTSNVHINIS